MGRLPPVGYVPYWRQQFTFRETFPFLARCWTTQPYIRLRSIERQVPPLDDAR